MRQQVNLLAPMFRKQRALFTARVSLAMCLLVALALGLIYGVSAWRSAVLSAEQVRLERQRDTALRRLNELAQQFHGRQPNRQLDDELAALTAERDRKAGALAALSRRELGTTEGFSPQFIGLARQRLGGLWLTRIELSASGGHVALAGVALSEELVPRYLRKLGSEAVFSGTQFQHAALERVTDAGAGLRFELRTQAATAGARR
jgi:Tfp pilus assembly protein PilN